MQAGACQWRPEDVAAQPLQAVAVALADDHRGMKVVALPLPAERRQPEPAGLRAL